MSLILRACCAFGLAAAAATAAGCSSTTTGGTFSSGSSSGVVEGGASSGSGQESGSSSGGASGSSASSGSDDASSESTEDSPAGSDGDDGGGEAAASDDSGPPEPDGGGGGYPGYDGSFPMTTDSGPAPSYSGQIPQYPDVGPVVTMDCPGDPTAGYTEYRDTFNVESPYTLPTNARFSITGGGIYNFWVFPNDSAHSPTAHGTAPRSEARWGELVDSATGGTFTSGQRIWSADCYWETSVKSSVIMQVHTTATGIGPVYMTMNGTSLADSPAFKVTMDPGNVTGRWLNMKVAFDAGTRSSQVYINNCPFATITNGTHGNGQYYFKQGVYHCADSAGCYDHYKNIHFYRK
jgi:hypothetical protein